jgi:rhomboid protease GluP
MVMLDDERWYCYKDDLIFFPEENLWSDDKGAPVSHTPFQSSQTAEQKITPPKIVPIITLSLIAVNVVVFYLEELNGGSENLNVLTQMGAITSSAIQSGQYYRLINAMFLHIGLQHLLFNMYALLVIGWSLERVYGHLRFLIVYLASGVIGSIVSASTISQGNMAAGASGAILGCLAALIVIQSRYSHISFGFSLGSAVFTLAYNLVTGLAPGSGIDIAAHFGGALGGILLSFLVSPPQSFFSHIATQTTRPEAIPANPNQQATEDQVVEPVIENTQKLTPKGIRTKIIVAVVIILVLTSSVLVLGKYPRLQVDQSANAITLQADSLGDVSGTVKVDIAGSGTFTITSISVSEDNPPISTAILQTPVGNLPLSIPLPAQLVIFVSGTFATTLPSSSSMTINLAGTWNFEFINMPLSLTTSTNVGWTSYSIEALPNLSECGSELITE